MKKLPHDWHEFIASLSSHRVRFLIVGAHAMAHHGAVRFSQDLDVFVEPSETNARRLGAAFADFGYPALSRAWKRLARPDRMATLGVPPLQIDVMTSITGVSFRTAWKGRKMVAIAGKKVPVIGRAALIANKSATGRAKDAADLALLEEATARRGRRTSMRKR
jgi:hypothetical protein